jgi:hypothetical protein
MTENGGEKMTNEHLRLVGDQDLSEYREKQGSGDAAQLRDGELEDALQLAGDPYQECTLFCWYCGVKTEPAPDYPHFRYKRCRDCSVLWARAMMHKCPECTLEGEEGFLHLYTPGSLMLSEDGMQVKYASGSTWCDTCARTWVYRFVFRRDDPETPWIYLTGPLSSKHRYRLVNPSFRARDVVNAS